MKIPSRTNEFTLVDSYKYGYRNREDITNLPPGVLVVGSQNVLHNVSDRIQIRQGYSVDGSTSSVAAAVLSSYDWINKANSQVNMRACLLTSAGNDGKLQYRYVDGSGTVTWRDLLTDLTSTSFNFTTLWDGTELVRNVLFVNGASEITKWNGAVSTIVSTTSNTITLAGNVGQLGFYGTADRSVTINGNDYTYSGATGSQLTGVSGDPTGEPNGSIVIQTPVTIANSAMTNPDTNFDNFKNDLISTLDNQVFLGSLTSSVFYVSKFGDYTDWSYSNPRLPSEGAVGTLDASLVAFQPQEGTMYVSCGKDLWFSIQFPLSADLTAQTITTKLLKSTSGQGAQSQALTSQMKNNIIVITSEPTMDIFGTAENYFDNPQTQNVSDPIKLDFDGYDFTDGSIYYYRYFIYVAVPKEGLVRVYNLVTKTWEAPQTLPISRFYQVNGELYGHSYSTSESYKLFTGYADRVYPGFSGFPIDAKASFSYQNYDTRTALKKANMMYVEGYINANTILKITLTYEIDGCASTRNITIDGSDTQIVCIGSASGSLGKSSLGKVKLGGDDANSLTGLPPKFRAIPTFQNNNFFECQFTFEVLGVDNRFELLAFGLNTSQAAEENVFIRQ